LACDEQHHPAPAAETVDQLLGLNSSASAELVAITGCWRFPASSTTRSLSGMVNNPETLAEIVDSTMSGDRRT